MLTALCVGKWCAHCTVCRYKVNEYKQNLGSISEIKKLKGEWNPFERSSLLPVASCCLLLPLVASCCLLLPSVAFHFLSLHLVAFSFPLVVLLSLSFYLVASLFLSHCLPFLLWPRSTPRCFSCWLSPSTSLLVLLPLNTSMRGREYYDLVRSKFLAFSHQLRIGQ